jgi:hypothetical protein
MHPASLTNSEIKFIVFCAPRESVQNVLTQPDARQVVVSIHGTFPTR